MSSESTLFAADTSCFQPGTHAFLLNLGIEHLDALLEPWEPQA